MMMIKEATNLIMFMMVMALTCYQFYVIEYALKYMLMPDLVPLFWILYGIVAPFLATVLISMLMT